MVALCTIWASLLCARFLFVSESTVFANWTLVILGALGTVTVCIAIAFSKSTLRKIRFRITDDHLELEHGSDRVIRVSKNSRLKLIGREDSRGCMRKIRITDPEHNRTIRLQGFERMTEIWTRLQCIQAPSPLDAVVHPRQFSTAQILYKGTLLVLSIALVSALAIAFGILGTILALFTMAGTGMTIYMWKERETVGRNEAWLYGIWTVSIIIVVVLFLFLSEYYET